MKKKVFVVTAGEYSDYRLIAAFDDKELAEKFTESQQFEDCNEIEEMELNPFEEYVRKGYKLYRVVMNKEGESKVEFDELLYASLNTIKYTYEKKEFTIVVYAKDKEHAAKIANEKRAQILAENKWGQ